MRNCLFMAALTAGVLSLAGNGIGRPADVDPGSLTTETSILSTLKPDHPRIIALDEDIRATSNLLQTDPRGAGWLKHLKDQAEQIINTPPVEHKLEGPRLLTQSRAALDRITLLAFLNRIEPDHRYVKRAILEMETASAFPDWNPSHFLDTAEMTAAMAIGYDWLYDELTTDTRDRVRTAIVKLGLEPGLKIYKSKPHWINGHNNWNQVCNGGLIIGALAIADEEPEVCARIMRRGKESLSKGMELFEPDGGWVEASGYWTYTMKYTSRVLSALHSAIGTGFGLDDGPGFSKTGNFILAMEGPTGMFFNWGDCGLRLGNLPEMFWLARRFDDHVSAYVANQHMGNNPSPFDLLWYTPAPKDGLKDVPLDWYFRDTEAVSMRESWDNVKAAFVAFKGGNNAAPHSNLDLGAFGFDAGGQRWAIELGGDNYNLPNYWNSTKRLAYYRLNSMGQNILTFDGQNQDIKAKSQIVRRGGNADTGFAIVDLSAAYPQAATKASRGFALTGGRKHLVIQDEFETTNSTYLSWTMHTNAEAKIDGDNIILTRGGTTATLSVLEPTGAELFVESAEQPEPQAANKGVFRVGLRQHHTAGKGRIVVKLSEAGAGPLTYEIRNLDQW